ncbi:MAG TPA: dipeptidase [Polyangiaceae bacterium]|jgi:membrane dipeptidase|nr:dipeptidase [Polyangiaceae bacterium]
MSVADVSPRASEHARAIHAEHPAIDLHADTLMWSRWLGYDLHAAHEPPLPRAAFGGHVDLPRMREGGQGAQFFGLVSLPVSERARGCARAVDEQIDALGNAIASGPGLRLARTAADVEACARSGDMAALLGIEGAHALEGDLDQIDRFASRGVRYLGLLHFSANEAGYPALGRGRHDAHGLTPWGLELVRRCEAAGVIVDLAHINRRGFLDACAVATKPPIVSHTGVLGVYEHWRNIDDAQLRAIADKGGVVGVIFYPRYLGGDGLEPVVKHMLHILDVVGEDTPALGSDWDGFIIPTRGLADPRGLPLLTDALLAAGVHERTVRKILRGNALRVLET